MDKRPTKILIIASLVISTISVLTIARSRGQKTESLPAYASSVSTPKPTSSTTVTSPDGSWALTMKKEKAKDGVAYSFTAANTTDGTLKEIHTKTVPSDTTLSVPANTFSPDNKYVFIKEAGPAQNSYYVFAVSGENLTKDGQIPEISSLFAARHENYKITDVTGWGGMNLIVFNTDKVSGGSGPSFWFEVPSYAFIQLSNRFD